MSAKRYSIMIHYTGWYVIALSCTWESQYLWSLPYGFSTLRKVAPIIKIACELNLRHRSVQGILMAVTASNTPHNANNTRLGRDFNLFMIWLAICLSHAWMIPATCYYIYIHVITCWKSFVSFWKYKRWWDWQVGMRQLTLNVTTCYMT